MSAKRNIFYILLYTYTYILSILFPKWLRDIYSLPNTWKKKTNKIVESIVCVYSFHSLQFLSFIHSFSLCHIVINLCWGKYIKRSVFSLVSLRCSTCFTDVLLLWLYENENRSLHWIATKQFYLMPYICTTVCLVASKNFALLQHKKFGIFEWIWVELSWADWYSMCDDTSRNDLMVSLKKNCHPNLHMCVYFQP